MSLNNDNKSEQFRMISFGGFMMNRYGNKGFTQSHAEGLDCALQGLTPEVLRFLVTHIQLSVNAITEGNKEFLEETESLNPKPIRAYPIEDENLRSKVNRSGNYQEFYRNTNRRRVNSLDVVSIYALSKDNVKPTFDVNNGSATVTVDAITEPITKVVTSAIDVMESKGTPIEYNILNETVELCNGLDLGADIKRIGHWLENKFTKDGLTYAQILYLLSNGVLSIDEAYRQEKIKEPRVLRTFQSLFVKEQNKLVYAYAGDEKMSATKVELNVVDKLIKLIVDPLNLGLTKAFTKLLLSNLGATVYDSESTNLKAFEEFLVSANDGDKVVFNPSWLAKEMKLAKLDPKVAEVMRNKYTKLLKCTLIFVGDGKYQWVCRYNDNPVKAFSSIADLLDSVVIHRKIFSLYGIVKLMEYINPRIRTTSISVFGENILRNCVFMKYQGGETKIACDFKSTIKEWSSRLSVEIVVRDVDGMKAEIKRASKSKGVDIDIKRLGIIDKDLLTFDQFLEGSISITNNENDTEIVGVVDDHQSEEKVVFDSTDHLIEEVRSLVGEMDEESLNSFDTVIGLIQSKVRSGLRNLGIDEFAAVLYAITSEIREDQEVKGSFNVEKVTAYNDVALNSGMFLNTTISVTRLERWLKEDAWLVFTPPFARHLISTFFKDKDIGLLDCDSIYN